MPDYTKALTPSLLKEASSIPRYPSTASKSYIEARNDLLRDEYEIRSLLERAAAKRRALPPGAEMPEYTFEQGSISNEAGKKVTLADLANDGRSVVLVHFMFDPSDEEPCPMCSLGIDSYNAIALHLSQRVTFGIVAKAPLERLQQWGRKRGWTNLTFLSSAGNSFNRDMNVEGADWMGEMGKQAPGMSVFRKDEKDGKVRHVYTVFPSIEPGSERGMDLLSGLYNILDLTPEGRGDWYAENGYTES